MIRPRPSCRAAWPLALVAPILVALALLCAGPAAAQSLSLDLADGGPSATGRIVQLLALLTVLSLAPSILVMVTSFTRIIVVLSFLRTALGIQQTPPNQVLISLALFLTVLRDDADAGTVLRRGYPPADRGQNRRDAGVRAGRPAGAACS